MMKLLLATAALFAAGQAHAVRYVDSTRIGNFHAGDLHIDLTLNHPATPGEISGHSYGVDEYGSPGPSGDYNEQDFDYFFSFIEISSTHYVADVHVFDQFHHYGRSVGTYDHDFTYYSMIGAPADFVAISSGSATIPEPASWAMMISGFGLVGGFGRRIRALQTA